MLFDPSHGILIFAWACVLTMLAASSLVIEVLATINADMEGDGIDLGALLTGAADYGESGDGTSRHSLDLPAGYDFEVRKFSE